MYTYVCDGATTVPRRNHRDYSNLHICVMRMVCSAVCMYRYYNYSDNSVYQINGVISLLSVYNINIYYGHAVLSLYIHVCSYYLGR